MVKFPAVKTRRAVACTEILLFLLRSAGSDEYDIHTRGHLMISSHFAHSNIKHILIGYPTYGPVNPNLTTNNPRVLLAFFVPAVSIRYSGLQIRAPSIVGSLFDKEDV